MASSTEQTRQTERENLRSIKKIATRGMQYQWFREMGFRSRATHDVNSENEWTEESFDEEQEIIPANSIAPEDDLEDDGSFRELVSDEARSFFR
jgi:hypothetical protein